MAGVRAGYLYSSTTRKNIFLASKLALDAFCGVHMVLTQVIIIWYYRCDIFVTYILDVKMVVLAPF